MRYPFTVYKSKVNDHELWIAESPMLKGCIAQGNSIDDAIAELELNETEWLSTAEKYGIAIPPEPIAKEAGYSGKFTVRISPCEHKEAALNAKESGVSLNQYVSDAIVAQNARYSSLKYTIPEESLKRKLE